MLLIMWIVTGIAKSMNPVLVQISDSEVRTHPQGNRRGEITEGKAAFFHIEKTTLWGVFLNSN